MSARADLLELSVEALTALSNPGFVKRALKDVAEGNLPAIEQQDDGTVVASYADGTVTSLAPAVPLRQASCSCPATGLCRHRVTLVLAYQAGAGAGASAPADVLAWCPSQLADAVLAMPRITLDQARRLAQARPVVSLTAGQTPAARLPMCDVRFLSRTSLALARCDCQLGGNCAHVALAVWAFVQASAQQPGFASVTIELAGTATATAAAAAERDTGAEAADAGAAAEQLIAALANRLWLDGSSQDRLALALPFEQALQATRRLGWSWVSEAIEQLQAGIADQQARASRSDPDTLLHQLTTLTLRLAAARAAAAMPSTPPLPARQILGIGVKGEVALDHLRLVPLGAQCWADNAAEGVRLIWADPDTLSVTVLDKRWPLTPGASAPAMRERRLLGMPLHRLASSQLVTKAARRHANGLITIGSGATQTSALPVADSAWDTLAPPLRQPDLPALRAHLRTLPPDFVRPLQAVEHMHVLPLGAVIACSWDAAAQVFSASVVIGPHCGDDIAAHTLVLRLAHDKAVPGAIDALAAALDGEHGPLVAVAGKVSVKAGIFCMTPLAVLTAGGMIVPHLARAAARALAPAGAPQPGPLNALLARACALLAQALVQGLRHQGRAARDAAAECANALQAAGLTHCAAQLRLAFDSVAVGKGDARPGQLAALHALLDHLAAGSDAMAGEN